MITTEREWRYTLQDFERWAGEVGHYHAVQLVANYRKFQTMKEGEKADERKADRKHG